MAKTRYDVWAVVKDLGGTNNLLPVIDELAKANTPPSVLLIANGKAREVITGRDFIVQEGNAEALLTEYEPPRVLITSMCSGGGIGRDLVPLLRPRGTITLALQDFWGQRLEVEWADLKYRPNFIVTNDAIGADIIKKMWPEFDRSHIVTTGFPYLDRFATFDVEKEGTAARKALGLRDDLPLVLFAGQGVGSASMLKYLIEALEQVGKGCYLMPRPHPRTKQDFVDDMRPWQEAVSNYRGRVVADWYQQCSPTQLVAACALNGVVVSMFSTTLLEAALLRASAISMMFPAARALMRHEMPGLKELPLITAGSVAKAYGLSTLEDSLQAAFAGRLNLRAAQQAQFPFDGHNASRAARLVRSLL